MEEGSVTNGEPLELYLHIPFCVKKCAYCDFLSAPATDDVIEDYVGVLKQEIMQKAACVSERNVTSIFFGGGTPSLLSSMQIMELMETVRKAFQIDPDAEITMECNPGTVTAGKLLAMKVAGINRLSIGLQSAQDGELRTLGRIHRNADFLSCYELARKAGFQNLNIDLIYGFPGQTAESFSKTLREVCGLLPEHISVYRLIIEEGTPFYDWYHRDAERRDAGEIPKILPTEEEEEKMEQALRKILSQHGYQQYEISNYARQGKACRHNIGYWTGVEYLGLGLGASSMMDACRFQNTSDLSEYMKEDFSPREKIHLTGEMQMEEFMFLGLRMLCGVQKHEFYKRFGRDLMQVYGRQIRKLSAMGLLTETTEDVRLTARGVQLGNVVFAAFLKSGT